MYFCQNFKINIRPKCTAGQLSLPNASMCHQEGIVTLNHVWDSPLMTNSRRGATSTPTLRLALERSCEESVNLQPSVPGVSAPAWGSGIIRDAPPEDGKTPKERGRSLLQRRNQKRTRWKKRFTEVVVLYNRSRRTWLDRRCSTRTSRSSAASWSALRAPCSYGSSEETNKNSQGKTCHDFR